MTTTIIKAANGKDMLVKSVRASVIQEDNRLVYGWASVTHVKDAETKAWIEYEDPEGDIIDAQALMKAATNFMLGTPIIKDWHGFTGNHKAMGRVVHSMPILPEMIDAEIIKADRAGWFVGAQMEPAVFERYLLPEGDPNKYRDYSIGFEIGAATFA